MTDKPARETNVVSRSSGESGRWYSVLSPVVLLVILIVVSFYPIFMRGNGSTVWWADYTAHRAFAEEFAATNSVEILPHFAYHLVIIAVSRLFPDMPAWQHGRLPVLAAYIGIGLLIYALLMYSREVIPDRRPWWMAIIVALIMLTITPFLIVRVDLPFLLGYINPTTYHNPTQIMLKLWVIPVSLLAWRAIDPKPIVSWKRNALTLLTIALIIGMTATKPNYTLVLIPGLVVAAAYRVLRHQPVDWVPLVVGLLGPSLAMLGYQYVIAFTNPDGTSIAFGFAKIFWYFSPSSRDLILEFLGSIAFPVVVYILYFRQARRDIYLNLCWLLFLLGVFVSYNFYEDGPRIYHGNFLWTGYITLFVLMFASLRFTINESVPVPLQLSSVNWRLALVLVVLGLHMISAVHVWNAFTAVALNG